MLPEPTVAPDPDFVRIVAHVEALACELNRADLYFQVRGLDGDAIAAAIHPTVVRQSALTFAFLENNGLNLSAEDYYAAHSMACVMRGIAYGLEHTRQENP